MRKKLISNILRVVISFGLIAFLFWMMRSNIKDVFLAIKQANRLFLALSFLLFILGMVLLAVRLKSIMKTQHLKVSLNEAVYLTFIGQFFSNFLPTATGGDIVKAYYAAKSTGKKVHSVACIIVDRMLGTFTLVLMVIGVSLFVKGGYINKLVKTFIVIALLVSFIIGIILFSRRVAKRLPFLSWLAKLFDPDGKMKTLYDIIYNYKQHPALLLNAACVSFLLQAAFFIGVYVITKSLGFVVSLGLVFLWMPIISTVSMAPSINGLGVREGSFVLLFGPTIGKEAAFALSILYLAMNFTVSLIGGALFLFKKTRVTKGV